MRANPEATRADRQAVKAFLVWPLAIAAVAGATIAWLGGFLTADVSRSLLGALFVGGFFLFICLRAQWPPERALRLGFPLLAALAMFPWLQGLSALSGGSSVVAPEAQLLAVLAGNVAELNRQAPIQVDMDTRLDRAEAGPGRLVTYFYTLPNHSSQIGTDKFVAVMLPLIKKKACSDRQLQPFLKQGVMFAYSYRGNDGGEIGRLEIKRADCE